MDNDVQNVRMKIVEDNDFFVTLIYTPFSEAVRPS
jgi:hypothetical protein